IPVYGIMRIINEYNDVKCRIALIEDANYRIYQKKIDKAETRSFYKDNPNICFYKDTQSVGFSKDIRNGIFEGATVVYWAFQILYFLGFEKILIAGLDMSNFHLPRFYENEDNKQPSFLETEVDRIIIPSFSHASQIFKDKNISV
ncbi:TPA: sugar glycosyltransferase, partial [Morganella morganii]|nr:sugar glycosyltransferase [Morganella morganii]